MRRFIALLLACLMPQVASPLTAQPVDMRITFPTTGGMHLAGTLTLPGVAPEAERAAARVPAVLLIQGSGPVDRNGNAGPHLNWATLELLAGHLAEAGIASLRYDKRGMHANSAGMPVDNAGRGRFFRWEAFVDDAAAALDFLRAHPRLDARRLAVAGHSEGGLIALELANGPAAGLRTVVLLATPGRPIGAVLQDQLTLALEKQSATGPQTAEILAQNERILAEIERTGVVPVDVPAGLRALYPPYLGSFLRSLARLDPAVRARTARVPILALHGGADIQASPEKDGGAIRAALATRSDGSGQITLSDINHALQAATDVSGERRPLAPEALTALKDWLSRHLAMTQDGARR